MVSVDDGRQRADNAFRVVDDRVDGRVTYDGKVSPKMSIFLYSFQHALKQSAVWNVVSYLIELHELFSVHLLRQV